MSTTLLHNAVILDTIDGVLTPDQAVFIEDGVIREVGDKKELTTTKADQTIDIKGQTLMPGLIDGHIHIFFQSFDFVKLASWIPSYLVPKAVRELKETLFRGFTTVRDVAGADFALANALSDGVIDGPRLVYGGAGLSQTGGHGDPRSPGESSLNACCRCPQISRVVDGPDAVQSATRDLIRSGANHIKLMLSGGVVSPTDSIRSWQFSDDEIAIAVSEANKAGLYVTGHTYLAEAVNNSLRLGLKCIEHGNLIDESSIKAFKKHDAFLVPTLAAYHTMDKHGLEYGLSKASHAKNSEVLESGQSALEMAHRGGVKLVYGTDLIGEMQQYELEEFTLRAEVQPAIDVIRSATVTAAQLIGYENKLGVIAPGAYADIIAIKGDPLANISVLTKPEKYLNLIIKDGKTFLNNFS